MMKVRIPWRLSSSLNEIDSLFKDVPLPYYVDAYLCNCEDSDTKTVIFRKGLESEFECQTCGNRYFYHANHFLGNSTWYDSIDTLFTTEFLESLEPDILIEESTQTLKLQIKIDIPNRYDSGRNRLLYEEKILYEAVVTPGQTLCEYVYADFGLDKLCDPMGYLISDEPIPEFSALIKQSDLLMHYRKSFLQHIKCDERFRGIAVLHECLTLDEAAVFIAFGHLRDFEFVYWKDYHRLPDNKPISVEDGLEYIMDYRREKSFKKAVIQDYQKSIKKRGVYDFRLVYLIARHIKDVNLAREILAVDMRQHIEGVSFDALERFFLFLINRYTPRQIEKLFHDYTKNDIYWFEDTVRFFENFDDDFSDIPKIECTSTTLHDALVMHAHSAQEMKYLSTTIFSYEDTFRKACGTFDEYIVSLPENGMQLYAWGKELHNCLRSYAKTIVMRQTTVYGIFKDETLCIAIEIREGKIIQANKKFNSKLNDQEQKFVNNWFRSIFSKPLS